MLYLASASPRRQELLRMLGLRFAVVPSLVKERARRGEKPRATALRLANEKAAEGAERLRHRGAKSGVVLGADTIVVLEGKALGKPKNAPEAIRMLKRLSGRSHTVITGVALVPVDGGQPRSFAEATRVQFRRLTDAEIHNYVSTGEPLDKAGAYGIQGAAGAFIPRIEGDYFNVVGLPLSRLSKFLKDESQDDDRS